MLIIKKNNIYLGDNLDLLKKIKDNSIDSVVSDFPYNLSFMGKKWDTIQNYQEWCYERAKELLRVLKPGGYCLIFGGTRTHHRLFCAFEDAGFEIKDEISWIYGCYSADTECLTKEGWKTYDSLTKNDYILQWDSHTDKLTWIQPKKIYIYDYNGEMIGLNNRHTEQLLTPNHRVYSKIRKHSRNKKTTKYEVVQAKELKKHWIKTMPLAGKLLEGVNISNAYLIGWWLTDAWIHQDGKACMFSQSKPKTLKKLKTALYQNDCHYSEYIKKSNDINHKDEHTFYVTGNLANYLIKYFPKRKLTYDVLNWDFQSRYNLLEGLLDGDGSRDKGRGYSEVFWSKNKKRLDIVQAICLSLNIRSHIDYKKGCVYLNRHHNTTQLQSIHGIKKTQYNDKVWCLKTETGAFVVRRNGKAFISGNSGFPKSYNISKGFDKQAGTEREVVGRYTHPTAKNGQRTGNKNPHQSIGNMDGSYNITAPSTKLAKQWDGWGTALKPAHEPIMLAQKPRQGTYCNNIEKWGVGGLNIDDSRVKYSDNDDSRIGKEYYHNAKAELEIGKHKDNFNGKKQKLHHNKGRFPANVIFDKKAGKMLDKQSGILKSGNGCIRRKEGSFFEHGGLGKAGDVQITYGDSGGASRFFYCPKANKKDKTENGRVKNNHPTVKPTDLIKYLVRLITPPNGVCLDICEGSGTHAKACILLTNEGYPVNYIGFEKEKEYFNIAKKRIEINLEKET